MSCDKVSFTQYFLELWSSCNRLSQNLLPSCKDGHSPSPTGRHSSALHSLFRLSSFDRSRTLLELCGTLKTTRQNLKGRINYAKRQKEQNVVFYTNTHIIVMYNIFHSRNIMSLVLGRIYMG